MTRTELLRAAADARRAASCAELRGLSSAATEYRARALELEKLILLTKLGRLEGI